MKSRLHIHDELESELCLLGGSDREELAAVVAQTLAYTERASAPALRDIALTCGLAARKALVRAAVVATSTADLRSKLQLLQRRLDDSKQRLTESKGVYVGTDICPAPGRTVFVFPGEGSQYPGMLRDLCLNFPACRSAFDDADTACAAAGSPLLPSQWIFPTGDQPEPSVTEAFVMAGAVQAVLAADAALLRLMLQLGVAPDAVVGAGVGEIIALECAGVFAFDKRANRIQALREGFDMLQALSSSSSLSGSASLAVTGVTRAELDGKLAGFGADVAVAREFSGASFGLCVRHERADSVCHALTEAGGVVRSLPLHQPFHTPWMAPALPTLRNFFSKWITRPARIPVYSCMTAAPYEGPQADWAEEAATQWFKPVRFASTIERLYDDGFRVFVEIGARGSLTASIDGILERLPHMALAANRVHRSGVLQLHHTLAALAAHGQMLDIAPLHVNRGSRQIDMAHPRQARAKRAERRLKLDTTLPSLRAAEIPSGLVAPAAPMPAGLRAGSAAAPARVVESNGGVDFPLLLDADVLSEQAGDSIALALGLSVLDHPFLADSALGTNQVSLTERTLRGLPLMPLFMLAEMMAEAARRLAPERVVVEIESLRLARWLTVEGSNRTLRVAARRLPLTEDGAWRYETTISDLEAQGTEGPMDLAAAVIRLAPSYPEAPAARELALRGPVKLDWHGTDLYPQRLLQGALFQNLFDVPLWGENGLTSDWVTLPRGALLRRVAQPRFALDPVLLGAVGSALAIWGARQAGDGLFQLPVALARARFFAPPLADWTRGRLHLFAGREEGSNACADAELIDSDGRLLLRVEGWQNRVFELGTALHQLLHNPSERFLTSELPPEALPALPQEVVCCVAMYQGNLMAAEEELWLRATAHLTLSLTERLQWREMGGSIARRMEWLLGRIAAKDAVRRCLLARYGRKWAAADIRIETDEAGKPRPQGEWRRYCGARMDISITHTADRIVAAVAPNAFLGIDIERRDRAISDEFAAAAFSPPEQEIAAESGESATALFRFWCAKEALAKALGTGLRYGASDLMVNAFDRRSGRISMQPTRLWLQVFPQLRDTPLTVHTCLLDNLVLAVCVLDPALLGAEAAHCPA